MHDLIVVNNSNRLQNLDPRLLETAKDVMKTIKHAKSKNTKKAYDSDWEDFVQ